MGEGPRPMGQRAGRALEASSDASAPLVVDCGSGGTRVWRRRGHGDGADGSDGSDEFARVAWPGGGRAPVLTSCVGAAEGREAFAEALRLLGRPCFVGATAGLRHALEVGQVSAEDVADLQKRLPAGCELQVLSPLEEARFECLAMRRYCSPSDGMLSMGGKSMQIAHGDSLHSLPFAMHAGYDVLRQEGAKWATRVKDCAALYRELVAQERETQGLQLDGPFVCVTDTVVPAMELRIADQTLPKEELVNVFSARAEELPSEKNLSRELIVHAARVLLLLAVVDGLFAKESSFCFRTDFEVSWTAGYFYSLPG